MFKRRYKILVWAPCYHCGNFNEYYRNLEDRPVCQFCGMPLDV